MKSVSRIARSLAVLSFAAAASMRAGETPIDISALANEPWTYVGPNDFLIINGSTFPTGAQILGGLPAAAGLVNESRPTACYTPIGSPYLGVLPSGNSLAPNTTAVVHLGFSDPTGTAITYTPLAVGGPGDAP
jgi:hypothetical protein